MPLRSDAPKRSCHPGCHVSRIGFHADVTTPSDRSAKDALIWGFDGGDEGSCLLIFSMHTPLVDEPMQEAQMNDYRPEDNSGEIPPRVRRLVENRLEVIESVVYGTAVKAALMPGKMLRTRLADRLAAANPSCPDLAVLVPVCAGIELVHAASLCHDDVIDNSWIRRSLPTVWRNTGCNGAILLGDLLISEALDLIGSVEKGAYLRAFIGKIREVCQAEAEAELRWRGRRADEATCLRLARYKTGPLFAFAASVCGGHRQPLSGALEEAGYYIGTAYQLADDLIDVTGNERTVGKTLGLDRSQRKYTLAQGSGQDRRRTRERIRELCLSTLTCLKAHPHARRAAGRFIARDLQPLLSLREGHLDIVCEEQST